MNLNMIRKISFIYIVFGVLLVFPGLGLGTELNVLNEWKELNEVSKMSEMTLQTLRNIINTESPFPIGKPCLDKLTDLANHFRTHSQIVIDFILYSGFGINHLGNQVECLKQTNTHYILLEVNLPGITAHGGFCLLTECTKEDLTAMTPTVVPILNTISPEPITGEMVGWLYPSEEYARVDYFSVGLGVTLALCVGMVALVLVGTVGELLEWHARKSRLYTVQEDMFAELQEREWENIIGEGNINITGNLEPGVPGAADIDISESDNPETDYELKMLAPYHTPSRSISGGYNPHNPHAKTISDMIDLPPVLLEVPPGKTKYPKLKRIIRCFSLMKNSDWLFHSKNSLDENLNIFNGMRVLALGWCIMANGYLLQTQAPLFNLEYYKSVLLGKWMMGIVSNYDICMDVFFFLSGFLVSLQLTQIFIYRENRSVVTFLKSFIHRYLKLLPLYIIFLLASIYIFPRLSSGPIFYQSQKLANLCKEYWYKNLLFFNNFNMSPADECNGWTWYLANDMQFFLLSPFILIPFCLRQVYGYIITLSLMGCSFIVQFIVVYHYGLTPSLRVDFAQINKQQTYFFVAPWCRVNTFLLGILFSFGYLQYRQPYKFPSHFWKRVNNKIRRSPKLRMIQYICGFIFTYFSVHLIYFFNNYKGEPPSWALNATYMSTMRPWFIIGMGIVVYPALIGRAKLLLEILGHPLFGILNRLTYGAYMAFCCVYLIVFFMQTEGYYFSHLTSWVFITFCYSMSLFVSFILTLLFESPFAQIEKNYIFPDLKKKGTDKFNWPCSVLIYQNDVSVMSAKEESYQADPN